MAEQSKSQGDMSELLDDALEDFSNQSADSQGAKGDAGNVVASTSSAKAEEGAIGDDMDAFFLDHAKNLAERMNTLFGGVETPSGDIPPLPQDPDKIMAGFKKMAEAASITLQGENTANDEEVAKFTDSITQAIKGLQEGADNLAAPVMDSDVANMFAGLNLEGSGQEENSDNMFLPFMEAMMQSMLSAEVLLPTIKELIEKYPKHLEEHKDTISAEDKERYTKQLELYKVIEGHLESSSPDDSTTVKRQKFKVVLNDMRRLQEYGQPPESIINEAGVDGLNFDGISDANPQCPMM